MMSVGVLASFAMLVVAMLTLWAPRLAAARSAELWWVLPFGAALMLAVASGLVDARGLAAVLILAAACHFTHHAPSLPLRGVALAIVLVITGGLLAHALPGFANPLVLDAVPLSEDSLPYTKYLNFDKGVAGLFLLGLIAPHRTARRSLAPAAPLVARFALVTAVVLTATVATGFARWDAKLPAWWALWTWSMVFLTALPEEAVFRHLIQGGLQDWLGGTRRARWIALATGGVMFGLVHLAGGWTYVALATMAGLGYGWIYGASGSIAASILAHTGLNLLHLLFFSYPALR